jgi:novobiocin biosynthesis protein NovU/D-mycarose 3-C-methyltransferase
MLIGEIAKVLVPLPGRRVLEMGSNNGAFLEALSPFVASVKGIEPSQIKATVPTERTFFTKDNAASFGTHDLFVARHCMAHLDDLRGTLEGVREVLTNEGWAVIENAYLLDTLVGGQFDQVYHEHMSYFALRPMLRLFESVGLHLRHVYHASIHGGSIAMFASKQPGPRTDTLEQMLAAEAGLEGALGAFSFQARACIAGLREGLRTFAYRTVDSYGATAKGNTLLNVLGPDAVEIRYAVDSTPSKQGHFLPGTGIRVISEEQADGLRPDAYLLTAWNYAKEILENQDEYRRAGGHFILPFPYPRLV